MVQYRKIILGDPLETEAVVEQPEAEQWEEAGGLPGFLLGREKKILRYRMRDSQLVYGLGETVRGINKRGWKYVSDCSDETNHTEDRNSLYAAQNFLLIFDEQGAQALFVDTPGRVIFDIGFTHAASLEITLDELDAAFYYAEGSDPLELIREFRRIIGPSYLPPKWAFGYGQSRWGYKNEQDIRRVVEGYEKAGIPLDMVYLDIDYMDHFKDFTVDSEAFPDLPGFVREMKEKGIHLIPIIDAGVKIEDGYPVYEEGVKEGYFCKKEDGEDFRAAVWPGLVHFPDVLNDKAREWFGDQYRFLLDMGIDGFWNDMNEPTLFYTEEHLEEVFRRLEEMRGQEMDIWKFFEFGDLTGSISSRAEDYRTFYHEFRGRKVRHDLVHNLYGYYMTRAAAEAFRRLAPDREILLFSRSSYVGMHRYGGVWTGDNKSWWSHLLLNLQQLPALNMCGFLYSGADTGGFGSDCTEDLMMRWVELSMFTPLFRNHAALGTRVQELYRFEELAPDFANLIRLRHALIPYLYEQFVRAREENDLLFTPLALAYPSDRRVRTVEDQLLLGDALMIAPVYIQNAVGRYVYLPEPMTLCRFRSVTDYDRLELPAGDHYIDLALNEVAIFVRPGHTLEVTGDTISIR